MLDVVEIMLNFDACVVCISRIAMHHLRPTRNTWLNHMAVCVERNFFTELVYEHTLFWARPNNAHIALKYVNKLWDFINTCFANKTTYTGNAHVIGLSKLRAIFF